MSALRAWFGSALANPAPAGYRPGALVSRLRLDLHDLESEPLSATRVRFRSTSPSLEFLAEEQVESQFLMHVVTTRFSCRIAGESNVHRPIRIRHRGSWKRAGIECTAEPGADEATRQLATRLERHAELTSAVLPLDFTRCELVPVPEGWDIRVVHFGASEVVYRLPPIRQYVRLSREQLRALLQTFAVLKGLL